MPSDQPESESSAFDKQSAGTETQASDENIAREVIEPRENQTIEDSIDLLLGRALTAEETFRITSANLTHVILIAGAVASGKTTLIASIFHRFQLGPFAGYLFAGSDTLPGFDERCCLARTASGISNADTERTKPGVDRIFLHLRVRAKDKDALIKNMLIVDLSGEHYKDAKDSIDECRRLSLIRRADHFVMLLDGEKLLQPDRRQSAKNDAIMLLRSCLDAGQLGPRSLVDVLFSKWDLIQTNKEQTESVAYINQVEASIKNQFETSFGRLRFFRIAAMKEKGSLPIGYGIKEPFPSWVEDTSETVVPRSIWLHELEGMSEFDRYQKRKLPKLFKEEQ
jgi:hypothetical protein